MSVAVHGARSAIPGDDNSHPTHMGPPHMGMDQHSVLDRGGDGRIVGRGHLRQVQGS